jgi:dolichol-phosphate mannosyltransferase
MKKTILSLIVACYNEEENIVEMYQRIKAVFQKLPKYEYEIVFVDNASRDRSEELYRNLAKKDKRVKIVLMSRNFGSPQPSFLAGIEYTSGEALVFLHGDIQDPPELLPEMLKYWEDGYDVVYGVRKKREGYGLVWNFYYHAFYYLLKKLAYINIPLDAGDYSLISKRVGKELLNIPEYDYYLRCLRAYVGFKQIGFEYTRRAREHGKTTENLISGLYWAKTIILNFSFKPLTIISYLGFSVTCFSVVYLIFILIASLIFHQAPPGIASVIVVVLLLGGIQLLSLSVIAQYIATIFWEVKRRPKYIVRETLNIDNTPIERS